jgi:hypothetical protein
MTLKPCPACGHKEPYLSKGYEIVKCQNFDCGMEGPRSDPDGAKWNALPRVIRVNGDCDTCRNVLTDMRDEPCLSCRVHANWEPKP